MQDYLGKDYPKLGFGLMRLPKQNDDPSKIDIEQVKAMVDKFLDAGFIYFDTAFVYDGGESEKAIKAALVDRYPREKYKLATKLCAWMGCSDERSAKQEFFTSLERTGAGYFDFYLLHALQSWNYTKYDEYKIWDFAAEQKAKGLIKNLGFSLHAKPELLDDLLTRHPEVDFVQLQLNYADWENPSVTSRENWEIARKHNKPIVVMEPVKGGILANPPQQVKALFTEADPSASMASWAVRFAASLDGVITVLSGMSNIEQMENNISYMKGFKPLDEKEKGVIKAAQDELLKIDAIPCTACHYCTAGCPKHISIPDIFAAMNISLTYGNTASAKQQYAIATMSGGGKASDCIACGQCERACPQQIKVIEQLKRCAAALE
jgi:uncharacterized protein